MESRKGVTPGRHALLPCYSPLEKTPHKATVVGDDAMSTAGASIQMAAECGGTTARDGQQDLNMSPANPMAAAPDKSNSRGANQIGQLQERPTHQPSGCEMPFSESESRGLAVAWR